jgi:hypothetical protein
LRHIYTEEKYLTNRLRDILLKSTLKSDYAVFSKLDAYPDERFLFTTGRILSLPGVGAAGGYTVLRNPSTDFEKISSSVIGSVFLNLNMIYRYRPMNYKEVGELQLEGLFIKRDIMENLNPDENSELKLEYILSKHVRKTGMNLIYSPDIMVYRRFPENKARLFLYIKNEAYFRAMQFKSKSFREIDSIEDKKFILSFVLLLLLSALIVLSIIYQNILILLPIFIYYCGLLISRWIFKGIIKGTIIFSYLFILQIIYGWFFFRGIIKK